MGMHHPFDPRRALAPLAAALALVFGVSASLPALAQEEGAAQKRDKVLELLEKLKDKGIISEDEYNDIAGNTPEGRAAARTERRLRVQKEALDAQKAEQAKERYNGRWNNGIVFETPDRRTTFSLGGRIHADYRYFADDTAASTFDIRRAYLTLQGKWNEWLTWDLTGDFGGSSPSLDVVWVNAAWSDKLQVRAGQFKMPFSLEELTSSRFIDFQERSFVNRLVPAKERGLMVHGVPYTGLTYAVALSNGQGKNNIETSPVFDSPDLIGRATVNVAELLQQQAKAVYHFGAAFSSGEYSTNAATTSVLLNSSGNTEPRGFTFFSPVAFNSPSADRTRYGFETALAYGPFKLQGEMVQANFKGRTTDATPRNFDKNIDAWYLSLHWMITGERYAETYRNGVFGRMSPITPYEPGGSGSGAWELAVRYSEFDATDFPVVAAAGSCSPVGTGCVVNNQTGTSGSNKAQALTVGLKWIWTPNFKIYLNYVDTKFGNLMRFSPAGATPWSDDRERAVTMRASFDW